MSDLSELFGLLPDVNFIEIDTAATELNIITIYEGLTNSVLYPGDPVRLFLSTLAAVISQYKIKLNDTGRMNLLRYSRGTFLDHIGALVGAYRTGYIYSKTELKFTLQEDLNFDFTIPSGTRVTSDGNIYFSTDNEVTIYADSTTAVVSATSLTPGTAGNGQIIGQLVNLVDPLAYVTSVINIVESSGGAEEEEDEHYRERIALAPESFSVAGPILAYEYWARAAHTSVLDVSIFSPIPGTVQVCPLLINGVIPSIDGPEIKAIKDILTDERRRPLCDTVLVIPPEAVSIDYTIEWFITKSQEGYSSIIESSIKNAVSSYEAWQSSTIGKAINPDALIAACRGAGAWRVEIKGLVHTPLENNQVTQFIKNTNRIIFGGTERG